MKTSLKGYRDEDAIKLLHELNRTHNATMKWINEASEGNTLNFDDFLKEVISAHDNIKSLSSKKIDEDLNTVANEEIRRNMF